MEMATTMEIVPTVTTKNDTIIPVTPRESNALPSPYNKILPYWQRITFWLIMAFGVFLRLYQFPGTPAGIWPDEADGGLDAYALLQHGTDRWGHPFPFYFPSWGSGQNVLQAYLSIPFIKLLGLNTLSIHLVPILMGILVIPILYLTLKKIYGTNTALLAAFLLATLPWYVMASRWGTESNMFPSFFLLSICTLLYWYDSPQRRFLIPFSLIPMAITFYAYGTAIIPIPIFLTLFIIFNRKTILQEKVSFLSSILVFLLIAGPFFLFVLENDVLHRQLEFLTHLPFTIPYLPVNRLSQVNGNLSHRAILLANIRFVIGGYHDQWPMNSISWISPLGWLVPPFAALGVYFSLKRQQLAHNLIVLALIGMLPTFVLFIFTVHRSNGLYIPLIALSAYGIISLLEYIQPINTRIVITTIMIGTLFFPNIFFYQYYFTSYDQDSAAWFHPGYDTALAFADKEVHPNELIYTQGGYEFTLFYLQSDLLDFSTHANIKIIKGIYYVFSYRRYDFALLPNLSKVPSFIAIVQNSGGKFFCQNKQVLYRDNTWLNDHWTVERCSPVSTSPHLRPHAHSRPQRRAPTQHILPSKI
jgi:4-amino-4-deoxy-L-arabinose transferase-like glycosyltransferase